MGYAKGMDPDYSRLAPHGLIYQLNVLRWMPYVKEISDDLKKSSELLLMAHNTQLI